MTRVVLDANVLIGGPFSRLGSLHVLHGAFLSNQFLNITTTAILGEVERAWRQPYWAQRYGTQQLEVALRLIVSRSHVIELQSDWFGVAPHRHDDQILGTAVEGHC